MCECEGECRCCPFTCLCTQCFEIRRRLGAHCRPCGGFMTPYVCSMIPTWRKTGLYPNYPNLDFLRTHTHQPNSASGKRLLNLNFSDRPRIVISFCIGV